MEEQFQKLRQKLEEIKGYSTVFASKAFSVQHGNYKYEGRFIYSDSGKWYISLEKVEKDRDVIIYQDMVELERFHFLLKIETIPKEFLFEGLKVLQIPF